MSKISRSDSGARRADTFGLLLGLGGIASMAFGMRKGERARAKELKAYFKANPPPTREQAQKEFSQVATQSAGLFGQVESEKDLTQVLESLIGLSRAAARAENPNAGPAFDQIGHLKTKPGVAFTPEATQYIAREAKKALEPFLTQRQPSPAALITLRVKLAELYRLGIFDAALARFASKYPNATTPPARGLAQDLLTLHAYAYIDSSISYEVQRDALQKTDVALSREETTKALSNVWNVFSAYRAKATDLPAAYRQATGFGNGLYDTMKEVISAQEKATNTRSTVWSASSSFL